MYGLTLRVETDGVGVTLRAFSKEDLKVLVAGFSSLKVHMWTNQLFAQVLENEEEWYDKTRRSEDSCAWAIVPDGSDVPVGITGLHAIDQYGSATSGIVIWEQRWWGKGVASKAHLARTLFAADYLNRLNIRSSVRVQNSASLKALQRVGYSVWGIEPRSDYRQGKWGDTYRLIWMNPERIEVLYPEGLPDNFAEGVKKAAFAIKYARDIVKLP